MAPTGKDYKTFLPSHWVSPGHVSTLEPAAINVKYCILMGQSVSTPGGKGGVTFPGDMVDIGIKLGSH